jgi:lysozyme family protein
MQMADWNTCFNWLMDNEDRARAYAIVPDAPPGAHAISGINSAAWPENYAAIAARVQPLRGFWVELFYRTHFWEYAPIKSWYAQLTSDEVAKRVFDASVNMGSVAAVRCLQQAVNVTYATESDDLLIPDGQWGLHTVTTTNLLIAMHGEASMVEAFQQSRVARYKAIAAANPALAHYLPQWIARAEK